MKHLTWNYRASIITQQQLEELFKQLTPEVEQLADARTHGYNTDYASINLPFDEPLYEEIQEIVHKKKNLNPTMLIVIGIGGSNLGTMAIHQALNGILHNELSPKLKIYFADTVDAQYINQILKLAEMELKNGNRILLNVVTKSGTTTETIANFNIFLHVLKQYHPVDFNEYVVATTNDQSPLWQYTQKNNMTYLNIPSTVGGRYSVFSAVGLFPLGMLDIDLEQLRAGARATIDQSLTPQLTNWPAVSAALIFHNYQHGNSIHDTFLFSVELEAVGKWYRQLMGESIGKEYNRYHQKVEAGITPTVSLGTTDLHSVAQLYLGGPRDKFTTFIALHTIEPELTIPKTTDLGEGIAGRSLNAIMTATYHGVQKAYEKNNRPFCTLELEEQSAYCLGALLQFKMLEMIYLGFLLEVNPFDQPAVEKYKEETRKILADEHK